MTEREPEVFVICPTTSIARGEAKAFSLSRIGDNGEARPFPIVIIHTAAGGFVGYVNTCPHEGKWLNIGSGQFFNAEHTLLRCGRHGATFEIDTGLCNAGACEGHSLEPIALAVIDGDICLCGVVLVEDLSFPDPFDDLDETMEIMIHPD